MLARLETEDTCHVEPNRGWCRLTGGYPLVLEILGDRGSGQVRRCVEDWSCSEDNPSTERNPSMTLLLRTFLMRGTALVLVVAIGLFGFVPRLDAAFVPSADSWPTLDRQSDMAKVQKILEDKTVRERLKALGFTEQEISARLDQLSDQEVHALATQLDAVTTGGSTAEVIIVILLVAILVVLVLQLSGKRIVGR